MLYRRALADLLLESAVLRRRCVAQASLASNAKQLAELTREEIDTSLRRGEYFMPVDYKKPGELDCIESLVGQDSQYFFHYRPGRNHEFYKVFFGKMAIVEKFLFLVSLKKRRAFPTIFHDCLSDSISFVEACQLASNSPCEDNYAISQCVDSGSLLLGVFDGHNGPFCSVAAANRLFDYIATAVLTQASRGTPPNVPHLEALTRRLLITNPHDDDAKQRHFRNIQAFANHLGSTYSQDIGTDTAMWTVRDAIRHAFVSFDESLTQDAQPDDAGRVQYEAVRAVISGSCGCVAHVDGADLHIANIGDSTAVMGVRHPTGAWTARQLSRDHTFDNSDEVTRVRGEHPLQEFSSVLKGGRLLGELMPLRAFGDVRLVDC